jgi:hypothetical protein
VLFSAGLSVEVDPILKYWYAVVCVGSCYTLFTTGLFAAIGYGSGLCVGAGTCVFFGVACSLSSKQVFMDYFERNKKGFVGSTKSMHARLLQGIALFQDALALIGFAILQAFERVMVDPNVKCVQEAVDSAASSTSRSHTSSASTHRRAEEAASACVAAATASGGHSRRNYEPPEHVWHSRLLLGTHMHRKNARKSASPHCLG